MALRSIRSWLRADLEFFCFFFGHGCVRAGTAFVVLVSNPSLALEGGILIITVHKYQHHFTSLNRPTSTAPGLPKTLPSPSSLHPQTITTITTTYKFHTTRAEIFLAGMRRHVSVQHR